VFYALTNSKLVIVVSDTNIKNNITISITHIHLLSNPINKTIHYAVNITSTEAKLFAIRYGINQTIQISDVTCIIIVIDAIHIVHCIFDSVIYSYQHQLIAILKELREFSNKNSLNSIDFWNCPSNNNWPLYSIVDKETKEFNFTSLFLCKSSWNFERKSKYDDILKTWKITF